MRPFKTIQLSLSSMLVGFLVLSIILGLNLMQTKMPYCPIGYGVKSPPGWVFELYGWPIYSVYAEYDGTVPEEKVRKTWCVLEMRIFYDTIIGFAISGGCAFLTQFILFRKGRIKEKAGQNQET